MSDLTAKPHHPEAMWFVLSHSPSGNGLIARIGFPGAIECSFNFDYKSWRCIAERINDRLDEAKARAFELQETSSSE